MYTFVILMCSFGALAAVLILTWINLGRATGQKVAIGHVLGSIAGLGVSLAIPAAGAAMYGDENIETLVATVTGALILNFVIQSAIVKRTMTHDGGNEVKTSSVLMLAGLPILILGIGALGALITALEALRDAGL